MGLNSRPADVEYYFFVRDFFLGQITRASIDLKFPLFLKKIYEDHLYTNPSYYELIIEASQTLSMIL